MKTIYVNSLEIKVDDENVVKMMECVTMETNQEILIRSKKEASKLSKQLIESSEMVRQQRYLEALRNNDRLYLNNIYDSLTLKDILKLIVLKVQRHF